MIGKFNHLAFIIPHARYFLNRLRFMCYKAEKYGPQHLNERVKEDLILWRKFLTQSSQIGTSINLANFALCLDHVNESMFPQKAYITQTRWMRRYLRKPREMKTRDYVNRVLELNGYLTEFPTPNNNQANKLEDDEIMDILEFSLPNMRE